MSGSAAYHFRLKYLIAVAYLSSAPSPAKVVEQKVSCRCSSAKRLRQSGLWNMKDGCPEETHIPATDWLSKKSTFVLIVCI